MTEFSLNKEFENLVRQTVDEQEQATVIEEGKNVQTTTNQQKTEISFKIITASKKNKNKKKQTLKHKLQFE